MKRRSTVCVAVGMMWPVGTLLKPSPSEGTHSNSVLWNVGLFVAILGLMRLGWLLEETCASTSTSGRGRREEGTYRPLVRGGNWKVC